MKLSLNDIEHNLHIKLKGPVKWGITIPSNKSGIYIIVTPNAKPTHIDLDKNAINVWINKVPNMKVGKETPTIDNISNELQKFWFDEEIILYVGKTIQPLKDRVNQYYQTEIGESKPHSGGYWIKTLTFLNECLVYWAECDNPEETEEHILKLFHKQESWFI